MNYRKDFLMPDTKTGDNPFIYLDNAATMQMPVVVMDAIDDQQRNFYAGVRGENHSLSEASTNQIERARKHIADFIGAREAGEVIFTSGATESINLVAQSFISTFCQEGDEIIGTVMEHYSNFLPWRELLFEREGKFIVCPVKGNGDLDLEKLQKLITERTMLIAVTYVSNVTGAVNPVKEVINIAHNAGAAVLIDATLAIRHEKIDVQELDCDYLVFSGHKIGAPTGTGVLYGKREMLELMKPYKYGGSMVKAVDLRMTMVEELPYKFEAGTQNITGIVGLDAAVKYLETVGIENISKYEDELLAYAEEKIMELDKVIVLGKPDKRAAALSFNISGFKSVDIARDLDAKGIIVGSGCYCAMPLLNKFGMDGAVRISPAFYNTKEEIDYFIENLKEIIINPV